MRTIVVLLVLAVLPFTNGGAQDYSFEVDSLNPPNSAWTEASPALVDTIYVDVPPQPTEPIGDFQVGMIFQKGYSPEFIGRFGAAIKTGGITKGVLSFTETSVWVSDKDWEKSSEFLGGSIFFVHQQEIGLWFVDVGLGVWTLTGEEGNSSLQAYRLGGGIKPFGNFTVGLLGEFADVRDGDDMYVAMLKVKIPGF